MSVKSYIVTFSLVGTLGTGLGWMMLTGDGEEPAPARGTHVRNAAGRIPAAPGGASLTKEAPPPALETPGTPAQSRTASRFPLPASSAATTPPPPLSPADRAAKVEQEANHDLRRLAALLNLDEAQQEQVFQTLARHSRHWAPEMQFVPATDAASAGKRVESAHGTAPGLVISDVEAPVQTAPVETTPVETAVPVGPGPITETIRSDDPLDEIMAILDPDQQSALIKDEMDRAAWWAEILPQLLPPGEVPAIDGTPPSTGEGGVRPYEGSDVLE